MGKEKNFGAKINTNGFKNNPKNINRTGANRKSFAKFNLMCKEKGIKKLSQKEYITTLAYIHQLNESEIQDIAQDKDQPLSLRLLIAELTDPNTRGKTLTEMRDYLFHKGVLNIKTENKTENEFVLKVISKNE